MSIERREAKNRLTISRILKAYRLILSEDYNVDQDRQTSFPRIGIVYHLIKEKDDLNKDWRQYRKQRRANRQASLRKNSAAVYGQG